ncbi:MAG: tetraacyldisaccharide 4'-kinase [Candidatus Omnitrophota bacterium]
MWPKIKLYILSIMKNERAGIIASAIKGVLRVLSWFYAVGIKIVDYGYKTGIRRKHKVSVPVVSVGNITLGGTGKTPFTMFLADHFVKTGRKPAVLIRGYGNDERKMLRDELPDVPIFIGQDRVASAQAAVEDGRDILLLDDGFQHRRIMRDLNVLMLDGDSLFEGGSLFPRGVLREPVSSLERADVLVLSKVDKMDEGLKDEAIRKLKAIAPGKLIVTARHKPVFLKDVTGAVYPAENLKGQNVCLVSGIADPDYFAFAVENLGARIVSRCDYTDHHSYGQKDINRIHAASRGEDVDKVVTTKKDYVKMQLLDLSSIEEKLFILDVEMEIVEGKEDFVGRLTSIING